jgi:cell division protein FtsZ
MGYAVMGTSHAKGERRALEAAQRAIASPLLEAGAIDGARGILLNITGSSSLKLAEVYEASTIIQSAAHEDANIIFGAVLDEKMKDEVKITVIATGFRSESRPHASDSVTASAAIQQARQSRWVTPVPEPQITRRADAAYEVQAEEMEFRAAPHQPESMSPPASIEPEVPAVEASQHNPQHNSQPHPQPPAPSSTRIWEAVQPPRPAASLEDMGSDPDQDELDVPAYLRKKNTDY